ncbi:MAG: tetratricopeptide repeat protein [Deltaproteobacteria bacterium]|nr:tetratricopeptide repeat protein [Deltaproteobacteria bacterium]
MKKMSFLLQRCEKMSLPEQNRSSKFIRGCLLIAFLIGALYINSLQNQFTNWDDGMIYQNSTIRDFSWEGIKRLFTHEKANTYQPVRMLSYAVDYHFWKLNPIGYRITNILFYILTCIMIFFTLQHLSSRLRERASPDSHYRVALFGSLLFAVHPVHVEAVTWLAARKEVLQGFFFFLAFYLYLEGREGERRKRIVYLGLVLFSVLLAVLSKPSAVVFPAVVLLYEITRKKDSFIFFLRKHWVFFICSLAISGIFTFILINVMLDAGGIKPYYGKGFIENILVSIYVFLRSLKLLFATVNYSAAYSFSVTLPIYHVKNIVFVLVAITLFVVSIWSLKKTKVIFFAFFFFLITMLPYLNIIPISTLLADRYVFIASFSYAFLLGILFDRFYVYRQRRFSEGFFKLLSISIFILLLAGYSYMTVKQNTIWENSYTLWADAVEKHPESNTANALMGVVYMELGMDEDAIKYLEKAVDILPYDYQSRNNLGIVYGRLGEYEKAVNQLLTAIWLKPGSDSIKINLSVLYQRGKKYDEAEKILMRLIDKNPDHSANLRFRLALLYKDAEKYKPAIEELNRSSELAPHIINPYEEMGNIYASRLQDREKAIYYYSKGIEAAPKAKQKVEDLRWMVQDLQR